MQQARRGLVPSLRDGARKAARAAAQAAARASETLTLPAIAEDEPWVFDFEADPHEATTAAAYGPGTITGLVHMIVMVVMNMGASASEATSVCLALFSSDNAQAGSLLQEIQERQRQRQRRQTPAVVQEMPSRSLPRRRPKRRHIYLPAELPESQKEYHESDLADHGCLPVECI
ncbi:Hypothetical Protein FCC1311_039832 [Hondaea fermentalgiana]|uniref:Uncharacterized protein n=1 Tax=Hondaea fermentalgiana TaxID=2315210 RepID=A0A2R5G9R1_9STRA|nr:Hypothetical Protein FCC1311_039832 [Hondaea fermentalgiana]|eukprot:GBG27760.1 Hypothetical Protein FCC1311_039832 [Hondaea fermentalgiana]